MFAVISRCVAHSYIFLSIITAEDAMIIDPWFHTDDEGDNVVVLRSIPTMMFTMATILRFNDFAWVRANIRAVRIPATVLQDGTTEKETECCPQHPRYQQPGPVR